MTNQLPIVAIVGQPNAGKSTLINKIAGKPLTITSAVTGTTRDRQYVDTSWNGVDFTLVDTAGLNDDTEGLELSLKKQVEIALTEADAIVLVIDGKEPVSALKETTLKQIRKQKKPFILAINKLDSAKIHNQKLGEFARLGVKPAFTVSSITGLGIGDLLDAVVNTLKQPNQNPKPEISSIAVSMVGKPNVGKSSLYNAILKEDRVVVSPIPGTTRAAIDSYIKIDDQNYTFIDTAGLKKKDYRQSQPDVFAGFQTFKAIRRSDVCFFIIDATEDITKQDQRIANEILQMEKGCIIAANKIDSYHGDEKKLRDYISHHFPFLWMCPMFFLSAQTGMGLDEALASIKPIFEARNKAIDDQTLSDFLNKKLKTNPPKLLRDQKNPKVFSLRQIDTNPPLFELLVNHPAAISQQFRKYLENSIIKELGFWGTPINLRLKGKDRS